MGMWKLKRRDFLKGLGVTGTGAMLSGNVWALNRLEPIGDTWQASIPIAAGKTCTATSGHGTA